MTDDDCPHGDDPHSCPPCQIGKGRYPPAVGATHLTSDSAQFGARTNARFKSQCRHPDCRGLIAIGDQIVMSEHGWVHGDCHE